MKRSKKPVRTFLLFVRPARPGPSWPYAPVGDPRWAGVQLGGAGWYHDQAGDAMTAREVKEARFAIRFGGAMPWAIFRVVRVQPQ